MRVISEDQRKSMEQDYLLWFRNEITKVSGIPFDDLKNYESILVGLEFMDFAVLSFRETGRINDLKQVTRYVLAKAKQEARLLVASE